MKIYLAAQYHQRNEMQEYAMQLRSYGLEVTSSWLRERADTKCNLNDESHDFLRRHAHADLIDIEDADVLIAFSVKSTEKTKRGGRHVEFGYAMALGKKLIVCGPRENIFHHLPAVMVFDSFDKVIQYLGGINAKC